LDDDNTRGYYFAWEVLKTEVRSSYQGFDEGIWVV
jgi:hypothetical protein